MSQSVSVIHRPSSGRDDSDAAPDHVLVQLSKTGDLRAFEELVGRYKERVYSLAIRMVRCPEDAEDVCQDVFVKAYESLHRFREDSGFFTWIYRITLNTCVNLLRRNKIRQTISLEVLACRLPGCVPGPDRESTRGDVARAVEEAVSRLPTRQRSVFLLRQYEGLLHEEIAVILGRSVGAVKANYFHAVRRLQKELAGYRRLVEEGRL